jgi:hypothetical protein
MTKVIGYFIDRLEEGQEVSSYTIFVAIEERELKKKGNILYYCPIGQHSEGAWEYLKECTPITKERYLEISGHLYTPEDYLKGGNLIMMTQEEKAKRMLQELEDWADEFDDELNFSTETEEIFQKIRAQKDELAHMIDDEQFSPFPARPEVAKDEELEVSVVDDKGRTIESDEIVDWDKDDEILLTSTFVVKSTMDRHELTEFFEKNGIQVEYSDIGDETNSDYFAVIRWHSDDIESVLEEQGIAITEDNLEEAMSRVADTLQDRSVEEGWDIMRDLVSMIDESAFEEVEDEEDEEEEE